MLNHLTSRDSSSRMWRSYQTINQVSEEGPPWRASVTMTDEVIIEKTRVILGEKSTLLLCACFGI